MDVVSRADEKTRPVALAAAGASAQALQVLLLRELLAVSRGTEIAAALGIAVWLAAGAAGSALGGRFRPAAVAWAMALAAIPSLLAARLGRPILGAGAGEGLTLPALALLALVSAGPAAALAGALFASLAHRSADPGRAYAIEAAGAAAGGVGMAALFWSGAPPVLLAAGVSVLAPLTLAARRTLAVSGVAAAAIVGIAPAAESVSRSACWKAFVPGSAVVRWRGSAWGDVVAVSYGGETSVYQSGRLLFSLPLSPDAGAAAHVALLRHAAPRRVLVVGGLGGELAAVLRHPVEIADSVELDPAVAGIAPGILPADGRVAFRGGDGRGLIRAATAASWDAILIHAGEPDTLATGRFYTAEFLAEARRALAPGGVLLLGPVQSAGAAAEPRALARNALLFRTVRTAFPEARVTAGGALWFVAGGDESMEERRAERGLGRVDLAELTEEFAVTRANAEVATGRRFDPLAEESAGVVAGPVNTDARPLAVLRSAALDAAGARDPTAPWLDGLEHVEWGWAVAPVLALALAPLVRRTTGAAAAAFASGAFGAGAVLLVAAAFVSSFGATFAGLALVLGLFMAGIAAGAWKCAALPVMVPLAGAAALAAFLPGLFGHECPATHALVALAAGGCVGAAFPAALRIAGASVVGSLYAFDLAGGLAGSLLIAGLALPAWGARGAAGLLAAICLAPVPGLVFRLRIPPSSGLLLPCSGSPSSTS